MTCLLSIGVFIALLAALYFFVGQKRTQRKGVGFVLAVAAAVPLLDGGFLLALEFGRWQHPKFGTGVITDRLSTTGEGGSRTIGGKWESRRSPRTL